MLFVAAIHFVVDGYGNIFAPLLPLLIPRLGLSLAAAGTLTMLFQLSASVSQIAFGHLADRWRPRLLLMIGPIVSVSALSFVGASTSMEMAAAILIIGGLGGAAFHPPAAALAYRLGADARDSRCRCTSPRLARLLAGPLLFAPFAQAMASNGRRSWRLPGLAVVLFFLNTSATRHLEDDHDARLPGASPLALR